MSLRVHFNAASVSLRFTFVSFPRRFGRSSKLLGAHFGFTSISFRLYYFDLTSTSVRHHLDRMSVPLRLGLEFTSVSLSCHFGFSSIDLRLQFNVTCCVV